MGGSARPNLRDILRRETGREYYGRYDPKIGELLYRNSGDTIHNSAEFLSEVDDIIYGSVGMTGWLLLPLPREPSA